MKIFTQKFITPKDLEQFKTASELNEAISTYVKNNLNSKEFIAIGFGSHEYAIHYFNFVIVDDTVQSIVYIDDKPYLSSMDKTIDNLIRNYFFKPTI